VITPVPAQAGEVQMNPWARAKDEEEAAL